MMSGVGLHSQIRDTVSYGIRHFHLVNDEMGENVQTLQEGRERPEYQRDLERGIF